MGADISHHPGEFRPSTFLHKTIACPGDILSAANKAVSQEHFAPQASEPFDLTKREGPMLDIAEHGVHENPAAAREAVQKMLPFDAHPDVFVVIAHDQTLVGHLPLFPEAINGWKKAGLKEKVAWSSFEPKNAAWRYSKGKYLNLYVIRCFILRFRQRDLMPIRASEGNDEGQSYNVASSQFARLVYRNST